MKRLSIILVGALLAACAAPRQSAADDVDSLIVAASKLSEDHKKWLEMKPRKLATRWYGVDELPESARSQGYKGAEVEEGLVILVSSGGGAAAVEGVAVILDGRSRDDLLKKLGWNVSDSGDPRVKAITRSNESKP